MARLICQWSLVNSKIKATYMMSNHFLINMQTPQCPQPSPIIYSYLDHTIQINPFSCLKLYVTFFWFVIDCHFQICSCFQLSPVHWVMNKIGCFRAHSKFKLTCFPGIQVKCIYRTPNFIFLIEISKPIAWGFRLASLDHFFFLLSCNFLKRQNPFPKN